MYVVYILKSETSGRYYIGHSSDISVRIKRHNSGMVRSTKPYRPWEIIRIEHFETKQDAYRREMQIKSYKHGNAFKELLKNVNSN